MAISYNKLWKLMIDRKMKKKDLIALSGISRSTVAKLTRDENVNSGGASSPIKLIGILI